MEDETDAEGQGIDDLKDSWKGVSKGKGKGKDDGKGTDSSDKSKNIVERKNFDKRVSKIGGEKGEAGEKAFKTWLFNVRKITREDPPFHDFLTWLADLQKEVSAEVLEAKNKEMNGAWPMQWLNEQLYRILSETCTGKLSDTVMACEKDTDFNGAKIFRDLSRDHLDCSRQGMVALGLRVVKPARATMEEFEARLRAWEEDVERYKRISGTAVNEDLKPVYLQDLMPEALKPRYDLEKHRLQQVDALKEFFDRMILDYKTNKAVKPKGIHELQQKSEGEKSEEDEMPKSNFLYELLLYAKDEDVSRMLGPEEMLTFQRWRAKGGGKGRKRRRPAGPAGGEPQRRIGR